MSERWAMPEWMEPYRDILEANIMCGASVEELMRRYEEEPHLARTNTYVWADATSTMARVGLLSQLRGAGMLK